MNLVETYTNRYKDTFTFTYEEGKNRILWEGDFEYCRYSWDNDVNPEDNVLSMVDPSGGPYVCKSMKSQLVIRELVGKYVDSMSANKDGEGRVVSFNIHLKDIE
jgi:hypothetical protein